MIGGVPQLMSTTEVVKGQAWTNVMRGGIGSPQQPIRSYIYIYI